MKYYSKWKILFLGGFIFFAVFLSWLTYRQLYPEALIGLLLVLLFFGTLWAFWRQLARRGIRTEMDISRILGKDAKEALSFGDIGIITYNDEYVCTWATDYFRRNHIEIENKKLTSWIPQIQELFEGGASSITGESNGQYYEIAHKGENKILYVKNVTELVMLSQSLKEDEVVIGILTLDNYTEYQSYNNEDMVNRINATLRTAIIDWAKTNNIFLRRLRSDRFLAILDYRILCQVKKNNFDILQMIKDKADQLDVSITLSMVFAYGSNDFSTLDSMLNELLELVQSRGGDQVAIKKTNGQIEFIGGNSEKNSQRSKVRVSIIGASVQDLMKESGKIFILGHVNSDYDCMGAALAMSNWARALGKEAYIVLKDVPRDAALQDTMDHYKQALGGRHSLITEEEALRLADPSKDLTILVDHGTPAITSAPKLLEESQRTVVIDHHRRSDHFVSAPLLTYVESQASSTVELVSEMLASTNVSIPIYEAEATIMYLGILVDTNRFKQHTSERTFQAAAALKNWGANTEVAEKALQEDFETFRVRNHLISMAKPFEEEFMIVKADEPLSRTMLSLVSDSLLKIKGCRASFTIGINEESGNAAISARSDGTFNVQKIMEQMNGGGHFSAAAMEQKGVTMDELEEKLKELLSDEVDTEAQIKKGES